MFKLGLYWLSSIQWLILIPIYVCLAPVCMISSSLFDWLMSWLIEDQTVTLIAILIAEWAFSALLIFQLIWDRTGKSIFFYQFVFFLACSNFILIGITYSLLQRYNFMEQLSVKVFTSLLLVLIAEKMQIKFQQQNATCSICLQEMNQQCIILKCKHYFHESCLWDWAYVRPECPTCRYKIG